MTSPEGGFARALPLVAPAVLLVRLQVRHHAKLLHLALHAGEQFGAVGAAVVVLDAQHRFEGLELAVLAVALAAHVGAAVSGGG